jgi:ABC-type dipeptide/oligopeptide/nickel transport system ATPase subunit
LKNTNFNFLPDESTNEDLFDEKNHQRVAQKIFELIEANKGNAITIGLEGRWGSGKTTIISIFKNLISQKKNNYQYLYIDAWEHEGDPLRRIFLEKIIQQIDPEESIKELTKIKYILSKRQKIVRTEIKKSPTKTGCIIAFLSLMIPFGSAILSTVNTSALTILDFNQPIYWQFLIGLVFCLAPVIYIMVRFILKWKKEGLKKTLNPKNWQFIGEDSTDTTTQEISEENERSSIEFEKYFYKILEILLLNDNNNQRKQIILIIDNLDRINAQDSLKIWSTIQTFLQFKNPNNINNEITKNLWIIVPYDENGLGKLWNNKNYYSTEPITKQHEEQDHLNISESNNNIPDYGNIQKRSFFDKCFQLRFEIPFTVQTSWEKYTKKLINTSLISLNQSEKDKVAQVLINTRESLADIPSPREIKTYINQVGIKLMLSDDDIKIDCISYYVYLKYHQQKTQEEIKQGLLGNTIPTQQHQFMLSDNATYQLSGILFGTSPRKGKQLLLEAPILEVLNNGDEENLFNLFKDHEEGFWSIFNFVIDKSISNPNGQYKINLLASAHAIFGKLWSYQELRPKFNRIINQIKIYKFSFPNAENYKYYQSVFKLFENKDKVLKSIWQSMWQSFGQYIQKTEFPSLKYSEICNKIYNDFPSSSKFEIYIECGNINNWCNWVRDCSYDIKYIIPTEQIITLLTDAITPSAPIEEKYILLMKYVIKVSNYDLNMFIDKINKYVSSNNGSTNRNKIDIKILDVIIALATYRTVNSNNLTVILKNPKFYNFLSSKPSYHYKFALIIAKFFPDEITQFTYDGQNIGNSSTGLQKITNIWINQDLNQCDKLMETLKEYNEEKIIWTLPIEEIKQIKNIILKAIKNKDFNYFIIPKDHYKKYQEVIDVLTINDEKNLFTQFIISKNPIENIISKYNTDLFFDELHYLYYIFINTKNKKTIRNFYMKGIHSVTKEQWIIILKDDELFEIIIDLLNKNILDGTKLDNSFFQAIYFYIDEWGKEKIEPIAGIPDNWKSLIRHLDKFHLERIKKLVDRTLWKNLEKISPIFIKSNDEFFITKTLDTEKTDTFSTFIESLLNIEENYSSKLNIAFLISELIDPVQIDNEFKSAMSPLIRERISSANETDTSKIISISKKLGISTELENEE